MQKSVLTFLPKVRAVSDTAILLNKTKGHLEINQSTNVKNVSFKSQP